MKTTPFLNVFRAYIKYHQHAQSRQDRRSPITIQGYCNKYLLISRYLADQQLSNVAADDFKVVIARRYLDHLMNTYSHNYAARCVDICATVLNFGLNEELCTINRLAAFVIPKQAPKLPTYFTPAQITKWEQYKTRSHGRQKAADLFVLVMHTGFDYGDLYQVGRHHLHVRDGIKYLIKPRRKNGNEAIIPLSTVAERILEKYDYKMRLIANSTFNEAIKHIADEIGINTYLTVKSGRKIFMMDKLNNKRHSLEATSRMGGHNSIKTTEQTYVRVTFDLVHREFKRLIAE